MTLLNGKIEIDPEKPLPEYDTAYAKAYAARSKAGAGQLVALVTTNDLPTRLEMLTAAKSLSHKANSTVRDAGVIFWPADSRNRIVFVYDAWAGRKLAPLGGGTATKIREEIVATQMVPQLAGALQELSLAALFHGGIRADNVYITESDKAPLLILGDFLAMPIAYGQRPIYETIARGLAPEMGRGAGTIGDDLYALGVTILVALLGEEPLKELNSEAIVQLKMERGSYTALTGEKRYGNGLTELLRGLLVDDPDQRWNLDDLTLWLEGRRLTPKQSLAAKKASRPLRYNGREYHQLPQIAGAMAADTKLAAAAIKNEEIARWLSHGLNDEERIKYLEESIVAVRRLRSGPEDERVVAAAIITLHPAGPIRYRGMVVFPTGLANSLAELCINEMPTAIAAEIIQNDFINLWMSYQKNKGPDMVACAQLLEKAKPFLENPALGFGVERTLYEISPSLPCLSPYVRAYCPLNMRQLLEALDKSARSGGLMDRHIAAFILTRNKKTPAGLMRAYASARDNGQRGVALLTLFSDLQYRFGPDSLKGIAAALMPLVEESTKRFKKRSRQQQALKDLKVIAAEGDLAKMLTQVDSPELLARDNEEFTAAKMLYAGITNEITRMEAYARNRKALAVQAGEPLAAVISVGLAFILVVMAIARAFMG